jgi:DNA-binding CsgD family transcriptional regulator
VLYPCTQRRGKVDEQVARRPALARRLSPRRRRSVREAILVVEAVVTTLARIAASGDPLPSRAVALLMALRSAVPFDAAWLAFSDDRRSRYVSLASLDLNDDIADFFRDSAMAKVFGATDSSRDGLPVTRSDLPRTPSERGSVWFDCLDPAGIHESLSVVLSVREGRHVGLLVLLFRSRTPCSRATRRRLAALAPALALGIDPMPCLLAISRVVRGVTAGTLLRSDGLTEVLPGLDGDLLLAVGSPVLAVASRRLGDGLLYSSFLWPLGGGFAPGGHARITVVAAPEDVPAVLTGVALVSPTQNVHGLTPRELEVLGLVIAGCSNHEIAEALVVAPRTVAAHIEHLLVKLDVSSRTTAAVRAEREGLYVPTLHGSWYGEPTCGERET